MPRFIPNLKRGSFIPSHLMLSPAPHPTNRGPTPVTTSCPPAMPVPSVALGSAKLLKAQLSPVEETQDHSKTLGGSVSHSLEMYGYNRKPLYECSAACPPSPPKKKHREHQQVVAIAKVYSQNSKNSRSSSTTY